jgi:2-polyprenyl-3-methyl-5-hydroxy-6-metoxy-1,4-benzoquinol methylase
MTATLSVSPEGGRVTLERMERATNYNAWLGRTLRPHLGQRVMEVGAGLGTVTEQIADGRELVLALEVEEHYVEQLRQRFHDRPQVRPYLVDLARADFTSLKKERLDTILLSNVLEHIPDDASAVRRFREILEPGGKVVMVVPALEQLFGSLDEAVGHYRRYTPASLRAVLAANGFEVESLEWMNLLGIAGWFVNGRIFRRRAIPRLQLRAYDIFAPLLARAESFVRLPIGMSLFTVARAV